MMTKRILLVFLLCACLLLTGGAYLHLSKEMDMAVGQQAKNAMMLFGSTSPSYLILQSLDAVNAYLADGYREWLADFVCKTDALKAQQNAASKKIQQTQRISNRRT